MAAAAYSLTLTPTSGEAACSKSEIHEIHPSKCAKALVRAHISASVEVSQEGATVPAGCVFVYTDRQTHTATDRSTNLIISSNVHFVPLAEIIISIESQLK